LYDEGGEGIDVFGSARFSEPKKAPTSPFCPEDRRGLLRFLFLDENGEFFIYA
jgi:hypothetical protein